MPSRVNSPPANRHPYAAHVQQPEVRHRIGGAPAVPDVDRAQQHGDRTAQADLSPRHRLAAGQFRGGQQQRRGGGKQQEAGQVEAVGAIEPVVGHVALVHPHAGDRHRHVDQEDQPPRGELDDRATQQGAEHRTEQAERGHRAHGPHELALVDAAHQHVTTHRHQRGAAHALQHARGNQLRQRLRDAAQQRAQAEHHDRRAEHPARAEAVAQPRTGRDQDRQGQHVTGQRGAHAQRGDLQRIGHRRHRGVDHGGIQRLHEERGGHQPQQPAEALARGNFTQIGRIRALARGRRGRRRGCPRRSGGAFPAW